MVMCCYAFVEIVSQHEVRVDYSETATRGTTDDTDAPVEIGRVAVVKVVRYITGQVGADIE